MPLRRFATPLALLFVVGGIADAQTTRAHFGPRLTYNFDMDEVALGAGFTAPVSNRLEFYPSFDTFLVDQGSLWALNADLKVRVTGESLNWLYMGGGLNVQRRSLGDNHNTNTGLGLFAGFESLSGWVHPYGELRLVTGDGTSGQATIGLNFTLGR